MQVELVMNYDRDSLHRSHSNYPLWKHLRGTYEGIYKKERKRIGLHDALCTHRLIDTKPATKDKHHSG